MKYKIKSDYGTSISIEALSQDEALIAYAQKYDNRGSEFLYIKDDNQTWFSSLFSPYTKMSFHDFTIRVGKSIDKRQFLQILLNNLPINEGDSNKIVSQVWTFFKSETNKYFKVEYSTPKVIENDISFDEVVSKIVPFVENNKIREGHIWISSFESRSASSGRFKDYKDGKLIALILNKYHSHFGHPQEEDRNNGYEVEQYSVIRTKKDKFCILKLDWKWTNWAK